MRREFDSIYLGPAGPEARLCLYIWFVNEMTEAGLTITEIRDAWNGRAKHSTRKWSGKHIPLTDNEERAAKKAFNVEMDNLDQREKVIV